MSKKLTTFELVVGYCGIVASAFLIGEFVGNKQGFNEGYNNGKPSVVEQRIESYGSKVVVSNNAKEHFNFYHVGGNKFMGQQELDDTRSKPFAESDTLKGFYTLYLNDDDFVDVVIENDKGELEVLLGQSNGKNIHLANPNVKISDEQRNLMWERFNQWAKVDGAWRDNHKSDEKK